MLKTQGPHINVPVMAPISPRVHARMIAATRTAKLYGFHGQEVEREVNEEEEAQTCTILYQLRLYTLPVHNFHIFSARQGFLQVIPFDSLTHTHILIDRILPMQSRSRLQSKRYPHAGRRCSDLQKAALTILGGDEGPIQREVVSLCPSLCDIDISLLH
jgi:hypothetical protein